MANLWRKFKEENPGALNYKGSEKLQYEVDGEAVAGLDGVSAKIPECNTTAAARAHSRVKVTSTGWTFAPGDCAMDESTFRRYITQFNAEDLCKMLGTTNDHCKCPHCKTMEAQIVVTHRNAMLAKAGKIDDPGISKAPAEPQLIDLHWKTVPAAAAEAPDKPPMLAFYGERPLTFDEQHKAALIQYRAHLQKDINLRAWINGFKYFGRALRQAWNVEASDEAAAGDGAADGAADEDFAPIIYFAHEDDAAGKETPRVPVTGTGLLEKIESHLNGHHDKITDVAKITLREPGSGSNDSDGWLATDSEHAAHCLA